MKEVNKLGDFIKIDRKILKWEWWNDINTSRLFIYMLIAAYWKDGNYKGVVIERGSFPSSISELAKETSLTDNEIRTALKHLKGTGEITSKSHSKYTVFTVKNYDLYQSINEQNHNQITSKITSSSQAINEHILKEDKNVKNEKKERKGQAVYYPNDELLNNAFKEFLTMRNKIKKPLATKQALTRMMNKIEKLSCGDNDLAIKILNQSTDHCWQDVYELKTDGISNGHKTKESVKDINADRQSQLDYLLQSIREEEENDGS